MRSGLGRTYAQALFSSLAPEQRVGGLDALVALSGLWDSNRSVRRFFSSPAVSASQKQEVLQQALPDQPRLLALLMIMISNRRMAILPAVTLAFEAAVLKAEGRQKVALSSAGAMDAAALAQWQGVLQTFLKMPVTIQHELRPDLLGGVRLQTDRGILDLSLKGRLQQLHQHLSQKY